MLGKAKDLLKHYTKELVNEQKKIEALLCSKEAHDYVDNVVNAQAEYRAKMIELDQIKVPNLSAVIERKRKDMEELKTLKEMHELSLPAKRVKDLLKEAELAQDPIERKNLYKQSLLVKGNEQVIVFCNVKNEARESYDLFIENLQREAFILSNNIQDLDYFQRVLGALGKNAKGIVLNLIPLECDELVYEYIANIVPLGVLQKLSSIISETIEERIQSKLNEKSSLSFEEFSNHVNELKLNERAESVGLKFTLNTREYWQREHLKNILDDLRMLNHHQVPAPIFHEGELPSSTRFKIPILSNADSLPLPVKMVSSKANYIMQIQESEFHSDAISCFLLELQRFPPIMAFTDCMVLAMWLTRMKSPCAPLHVPLLVKLGKHCFSNYLSMEKGEFFKKVKPMAREMYQLEKNYAMLLQKISELNTLINQTHELVNEVLPKPMALYFAGSLLNVVIQFLSNQILSWRDITAKECTLLKGLCFAVLECEYTEWANSSKLKVLGNTMDFGLKEIKQKYDQDFYKDFTKRELVCLVEAMFQESTLREEIIKSIG